MEKNRKKKNNNKEKEEGKVQEQVQKEKGEGRGDGRGWAEFATATNDGAGHHTDVMGGYYLIAGGPPPASHPPSSIYPAGDPTPMVESAQAKPSSLHIPLASTQGGGDIPLSLAIQVLPHQ